MFDMKMTYFNTDNLIWGDKKVWKAEVFRKNISYVAILINQIVSKYFGPLICKITSFWKLQGTDKNINDYNSKILNML